MKEITIERSIHIEAPDVHAAANVGGISYCSNRDPWFVESYRRGSEYGTRRSEDNGVLYQNGCLFGTWRADGSGLDWEAGDYVTLPRAHSADGGDEISADFLPDGRLLQIIRARFLNQPQAELPSCKFIALSSDSGRTWSEPEPLRYTDGELAYSPACLGNVFRSKKNGRFYLITNLNDWPSYNCDPRSTLQIAELDTETLRVIRESVTVIETRREGEPLNIRFSNWRSYEDRATGDVVLFMTACPGDAGRKFDCGCSPHCYRYDIHLPDR